MCLYVNLLEASYDKSDCYRKFRHARDGAIYDHMDGEYEYEYVNGEYDRYEYEKSLPNDARNARLWKI